VHSLFQIINGKYVEGFYIYARNLDSINQPSYKMLTVLNGGGGGATTCTISGLMKYTRYEFFIVPFYKNVDGKPSNSRIARTMEDGKYLMDFLFKSSGKITTTKKM
jgi:roundabout, axon guidance receptor 2